jgi:dethiobiotin synthetase
MDEMKMKSKQSFFVTGTDTEVGKTFASCVLLKAAEAKGLRTMALKPVSAGAELVALSDGRMQLQNEDAQALQQHMSVKLPYEQVNPIVLETPASPHIAAAISTKTLQANRIAGFCRGALTTPADFVLIEGAGGWRVPISNTETMADLARQLEMRVILVVGLRLGCLNHAFLTAEAIRRDGLELAGWIGNTPQVQEMSFIQENIATLRSGLAAPCLGILPYIGQGSPQSLVDNISLDCFL